MKFFKSYLPARLLVTAIAVTIAVSPCRWLAFPVMGLTCGIATRDLRCCVSGIISGAAFGLIFALLPVSSCPPEGIALAYFAGDYAVAVFGASVAAALQLPDRRLIFTSMVGSTLSLMLLILISSLLRHTFREELRALEAVLEVV